MSMHPAETYVRRLREYQWESLMLYRARSEGWSDAAVQGGIIGVTDTLERLWHAQEALHQHIIDRTPTNVLIDEAVCRAHNLRRGWRPDPVGFVAAVNTQDWVDWARKA